MSVQLKLKYPSKCFMCLTKRMHMYMITWTYVIICYTINAILDYVWWTRLRADWSSILQPGASGPAGVTEEDSTSCKMCIWAVYTHLCFWVSLWMHCCKIIWLWGCLIDGLLFTLRVVSCWSLAPPAVKMCCRRWRCWMRSAPPSMCRISPVGNI